MTTNGIGRCMREGECVIVRSLGTDSKPDWCDGGRVLVSLPYSYHWLDGRSVICWSRTHYEFLEDWPAIAICACERDHEMARCVRESAACVVYRADHVQAMWVIDVLLLPHAFVAQLVSALEQHPVVQIQRRNRRHLIKPLSQHGAVPESPVDPVEMLRTFAEKQLRFALVHNPPVISDWADWRRD